METLQLFSENLTKFSPSRKPFESGIENIDGEKCYGNERLVLSDLAKFYNNQHLSDVILVVGDKKFYAHKLVLVRSSEVFERMLMGNWKDADKTEVELVEEGVCQDVFPEFLRFLYSCTIHLNIENTLPVLSLADKYNIPDLCSVCIEYACSSILTRIPLKEVFSVWFQYGTLTYHRRLTRACVKIMAENMDDFTESKDWESEWIRLEKNQVIEFLKCTEMTVRDEHSLFKAALKWLRSPADPSRNIHFETNLKDVLEFIRFPMITPDQLGEIEHSDVGQQYPQLFQGYISNAFRYHGFPLSNTSILVEGTDTNFVMRNYTALRWDSRFVIRRFCQYQHGDQISYTFSTKSATFPAETWNWELRVFPKGIDKAHAELRVDLHSREARECSRSVEYQLSVVDKDDIQHAVVGAHGFSKARPTVNTEIGAKVPLLDICHPGSPLLVEGCLILQIRLKPPT